MPFRSEWLQELIQLVDFLNLELGIMHQDIAPRNLTIDPDSQKILLFDWDRAAYGQHDSHEGRDDVLGVLLTMYELITNDRSFSRIPHWERTLEMVQNISDWPRNRELDVEVSKFRNYLNEWVAKRIADPSGYFNAPAQLTWPDLPTPADYEVPFELGTLENGEPRLVTGRRLRRTALKLGQYCFRWERSPQRLIEKAEEAR